MFLQNHSTLSLIKNVRSNKEIPSFSDFAVGGNGEAIFWENISMKCVISFFYLLIFFLFFILLYFSASYFARRQNICRVWTMTFSGRMATFSTAPVRKMKIDH
jgi:hypothetical protein